MPEVQEIFDPEGAGYDYASAMESGGKPDAEGHWGSLDPRTGMVLKGRQHETWDLMEKEEKKLGNIIIKRGERYFSQPETPEVEPEEKPVPSFDIRGALEAGWSYEEIVHELGPTIDFDIEGARENGYSYQEIAEYLSTQTYPPYQDTAEALKRLHLPRINDPNNLTAYDRYRIDQYIKTLEPEISHAARTNAIAEMKRRQYGEITIDYPSFTRAVKNLPKSIRRMIEEFGSLLVGLPMLTVQQIKEVGEKTKLERKQTLAQIGGPPLTEEELQILQQPYYLEQKLTEGVEAIKEAWPRFKKDPLLHAGYWIEEHPADTLLFGLGAWQAAGWGVRATGQATKLSKVQELLKITGREPWNIANIELARHYSKNPLTKAFIQKPFDLALEKYPKLKVRIEKYKGGKLTMQIRNKYSEMNFVERAVLHHQILDELEKLSPDELKLAMPYLEGRLHFMENLPGDVQGIVDLSKGAKRVIKEGQPTDELAAFWAEGGIPSTIGRGVQNINPQRIKDFEAWYRKFQKEIEHGFKLDETMTPAQLEDVIYKPIEIETGLSREAIKEELGEFLPSYVHHFFPEKAKDLLSVHFAETTGRRYKPGALKRRRGARGYSEDMTEVLPRIASSYVKWKNTQAFLKEFTDTFGIQANLKNITVTKEGLKVKRVIPEGERTAAKITGETLEEFDIYPNHKIVAPDGLLRFYKGEVDVWKEIAKRMDDTTDFDEAVVGLLEDLQAKMGPITKEHIGVTKNINVWLVPNEAYKKLETMATPLFGSRQVQDIIKIGVDTPTQLWKDSVLAMTPRWIKNNVIGDIIFNSFEGVGPLSYVRAMQSYGGKYKDILPDEVVTASFANIMKYNPKLGSAEETLIGSWIKSLGETRPAQIAKKVKDAGYGINTAIEQPFVRALYIKEARQKAKSMLKEQGIDITEDSILTMMGKIKDTPELKAPIMVKLKETLPVFNILGSQGIKYGRRVMPFLNWYKFMLKYAAHLPARHPFKLAGVRGLSALGEEHREQAFIEYFPYMKDQIEKEGGIPRRFSGLWPIGIDEQTGEGIFFNARGMNPFRTIEDFTNLRIMSMMSPIIKVGVEQAIGVDTFTGQKFTSPYPLEVSPEGTVEEKDKPVPGFFHHVFRQFPQFTLLEQILTPAQQYSEGTIFNPKPIRDPITGEPKYPIKSLDKILNYMGIDRKTVDVEEWFYKYQERIRKKGSQTHRNLLFEPHALTLEEHKIIVQDILSDEKVMDAFREAIKRRKLYEMKTKKETMTIIKESKEEEGQ